MRGTARHPRRPYAVAVAALLIAVGLGVAPSAQAAPNLVVNGSFEDGYPGNNICGQWWYSVGYGCNPSDTSIPGWTQTGGGVDWHAPGPVGEPAAEHGLYLIDLVGDNAAGAIEQDIPTTPGQGYTLSFSYGSHPNCVANWSPGGIAAATARAGTAALPISTRSTTLDRRASLAFVGGPGATTKISFTSDTTTGCGGVTFDRVEVVEGVDASEASWIADGTAFDEIGGHNGTLFGAGVTYGPGVTGAPHDSSFAFNGTDGRVETDAVIGNFGTADAYISFDIRRNGTGSGANQTILSKRQWCNTAPGWVIYLDGTGIRGDFVNGNNWVGVRNSAVRLDDGAWHKVVVARRGSYIDVIVDGVKVTDGGWAAVADVNNPHPLRFGSDPCAHLYPPLNGSVDNIRISAGPLDYWPPTISANVSPAPNAAGWNRTDATVSFTCADGQTSIASCSGPVVVGADTAGQLVTGTAVDAVGNSANRSVTVKLDETPPTLSGAPTTSPNAAGWYRNNVAVQWTCSDALSGVATCPANSTATGEGANVSVSANGTDVAGNQGTGVRSGLKIDRTAPTTTPTAPGGYQQGPVNVTLAPTDNLSGVAATYYALDGGSQQQGTSVNITGDGAHTLSFYSVDVAGNAETPVQIQVFIDDTAPTITHLLSPVPNAAGWNNSVTDVSFSCSDAGSGIATCTGDASLASDGGGQSVEGNATDNAGNTATDTAVVNVDQTVPTISAAVSPLPNGAGWNSGPVTALFTCNDATSGISSCTAPVEVSGEGAGQTADGTAVDAASNSANATAAGINIDLTAPLISGEIVETPTADGWFAGPVTVHWTCSDALSGVAVCPADTVVSAEGADLSAVGVAYDAAGNSASATVDGIDIDLTLPTITGAPTAAANGNGWYNADVTVAWSCDDALSGIASCAADEVLTGEGANLGASGSAVDRAGNSATGDVEGVNIDRTAPATTASVAGNSGTVTVTLTASDGLSGVEDTLSSLDGAPLVSGTTVNITGDGYHTLAFHSVDAAGNTEAPIEISVLVDDTAPTIVHAIDPAPNAAGWHRSAATVSFTCDDDKAGVASCSEPTVVDAEGAAQVVVGTAVDNAGNQATDSAIVHLDLTAPTITGARAPDANAAGWVNAPVTVNFTCNDALSGVAACSPSAELGEGEGQSASGEAIDVAGNSATATVDDINVDLTDPLISGEIVETPNANGWFAGSVTVHWTCSDALSGVAVCPADTVVTTDGANQSVFGVAVDRAGNDAMATVDGINIDTDGPVITATRDVAPNENGWNNTDVTVAWTCTDDEPGATLDVETHTFTSNSATHSKTVTCTDVAGNTATDTQTAMIDKIAPVTTFDQFLGGDVRGNATDNLSGVASTRMRWRSVGTIETDAVCYAGCGTLLAKWRATPPQPRSNVYFVAARSVDLAGNVAEWLEAPLPIFILTP